MSAPSEAPPELKRALDWTRRRLSRREGARRGAGWLLAAILTAELGLLIGGPLEVAFLAAAGLALGTGLWRGWRTETPSAALAAGVLDAHLGSGAQLSAAAEALAGDHPRFASRLYAGAQETLASAELSRLVPWKTPTGLVLGLAAALLLPLLVQGERAQGGVARIHSAPSLLAPQGGGGGGEATPPPGGKLGLAPVANPSESPEPAGDPLAALPLDQAQAFRERLAAALKAAPPPSTPAAGSGSALAASLEVKLERALRSGDAAGALRELERLEQAAKGGERAAALSLRALAEGLGAPGAGRAPAEPGGGAAGSSAGGPTTDARRERLPWVLREASRRYFSE